MLRLQDQVLLIDTCFVSYISTISDAPLLVHTTTDTLDVIRDIHITNLGETGLGVVLSGNAPVIVTEVDPGKTY
jgi:hypothetical protein